MWHIKRWLTLVGVAMILTLAVLWLRQPSLSQAGVAIEFPVLREQVVREGQPISLSCAAKNRRALGGDLTYSLVGETYGAEIDSHSGVFTWTPGEKHGPGKYAFAVQGEFGKGEHADTTSFQVRVDEHNQPPVMQSVADQTVRIETDGTLEVQLIARDDDLPSQRLVFQQLSLPPPRLSMQSDSGLLTWKPTDEDAGQTYDVVFEVRDDGTPPLATKVSFQIYVPPTDPWYAIAHRVLPAIYLLAVEDASSTTLFPFGTACAIDDHALLTSAVIADELSKRLQAGWKVWALQPGLDKRIPIEKFQVHKGYQEASDAVAKIYFDLAILSVDEKLETTCQIAAPRVFTRPPQTDQLLFIGFSPSGEEMDRFDNPVAHDLLASVVDHSKYGPAGEEAGIPVAALMHFTLATRDNGARAPDVDAFTNLYGSPIFNAQGKVMAIYAERAASDPEEPAATAAVHYAVIPTLARAWAHGQGHDQWIATGASDTKPDE